MSVYTGRPAQGQFEHAALIVESDDTLGRLLVPILRNHVAAGESVLVVVSPHTERVLRDWLQGDAEAIEWGASDAFYQRLGLTFEGFRRYLERQHAEGRTVHVIAEPNVRTELAAPVDRVAAYLNYEALCNDVYAAYGCPVTCIWDSREHPTLVIEGVRSIHAQEITEQGLRPNATFVPAADYLAARADVVMPPAPDVVDADFTVSSVHDLASCRSAVRDWASCHGFSTLATSEITTATSEVLDNGLQHGRPPVRLRAWHHHKTLVIQVDDHGGRPIPPDAGYRPREHPAHGTGLWIARQLADVLLTNTSGGLTAVRMYFPYDATHRSRDDEAG